MPGSLTSQLHCILPLTLIGNHRHWERLANHFCNQRAAFVGRVAGHHQPIHPFPIETREAISIGKPA